MLDIYDAIIYRFFAEIESGGGGSRRAIYFKHFDFKKTKPEKYEF